MASTAWTGTRQELVTALQAARAENELLRREYANRLIRNRQRAAAHRERQQAARDTEPERARAAAQQILDNLPADPQAAWHRTTLEHALRKASA